MPVDRKATKIIANSNQHEGMDASKNTGSRASKVLTHADHGWAWVVLLGSCINAFVLGNAEACFSVLFVEFITVFAEKRNVIALVGSLQTGITLIAGPVFSRLAEEYGYRLVIVTGGMLATGGMCLSYGAENLTVLIGAYGMLTGFGRGMIYAPSQNIAALYFEKKRALATGLIQTVSALGALTGPLLCVKIIELYTWEGAMIIIAGTYLQTVAASALLRDVPKAAKEALDELRNKKRRCMLPTTDMVKFGVHGLSNLVYGFGLNILMTFCVLYGTQQGMSLTLAALMMSAFNVSNVIARLLVAAAGDRPWFPRQLSFGVATLAGGVFGLLFLAAGKLWVFSLCCVLYGASYGIKLSIQTPILVDLFGIQHLPTVQSLYYLFNGIGAIMGSLVAGFLMGYTGDLRSVFKLCGIMGIASGVLQGGAFYIDYRQKRMRQEPALQTLTETAHMLEECC